MSLSAIPGFILKLGQVLKETLSVFSHIRTEYGQTEKYGVSLRNSFEMRENADQNNSEYGHFSSSET